jgi:hypothetical protein
MLNAISPGSAVRSRPRPQRAGALGGTAALILAAAMFGEATPARAQTAPAPPETQTNAPPSSGPATEDAGGGAGVNPDTGSGVISYPPSFFAQYRPTNASDMVNRIPGFSMNQGDDVRGFGGSTGNVLIDGQRPSSKSVNVSQFVQRIPIDQVERIDLIRGGAPGIDMQGQPVVVNIIRSKASSSGGAVQLMLKPFPADKYYGVIPRVEYFWRNDRLSIDWQANARQDQNFDTGEGLLVRTRPNGTTQIGDFISRSELHNVQTNGSIEYLGLGGILRFNGGVDRQDQDRREYVNAPFNERSQVKLRRDKAEIGGDYQRDFNRWLSGQFIALKTWTDDRQSAFNLSPTNAQQSIEDALGGETILRGTLSAVRSPQMRFEFGAEGAFNYLDATSSLIQNGRPVVLPAANIRVEEKRAEGFGAMTWNPSSRFGVETGLRWETSTITSEQGAISQEKTLNFAKPRLILSFAPDAASQIRLRLERTVGQLNFKDFAATTQLEAATVTAGNPDIEPERAWLAELALERRFWGRGALVLTLSHAEVSHVVDLIPINNQFDAPGNIGDGQRQEARINLTVPLDRLGISGGLIRINQTVRWSKVIDPVTGQERRISNQRLWDGDFHISKSIQSWKSVVSIEAGQYFEEAGYRINEIRTTQDTPLWKLIWDWNPRPDLIFRFQYENFTGKERVRQRVVYTGPRSNKLINFSERRNAELPPFWMFRMRKTF